jgi:glycosyltransferase involved in cell wall biosynthesis
LAGLARSAWRTARAESLRSAVERYADRLADRRRERSFAERPADRLHADTTVLNVLPFPLLRAWGGTSLQLMARLAEEARLRTTAVAMPAEGSLRIEVQRGENRWWCSLTTPWRPDPLALRNGAFEDALARAADATQSTVLHFESLLGVPLASLLRLRERGFRLALSVHDFALFCPRPHLIEARTGGFCDFCRDPDRCFRCLAGLGAPAAGYQEQRRGIAAELLRQADLLIFPSPYLRERHARLFPASGAERGLVVEPALDLPAPSPPRAGLVRRVAFVGTLQPHKGAALLPEIAQRLATLASGRPQRLSVFGGGDPQLAGLLRQHPDLRLRGWYRSGSLARRLRQEGIDLALLLSTCPESHGLALDECLVAGVPVIAFGHGALAERVERLACGKLVPLEAGAAGVADAVAALVAGGERLHLCPERWTLATPRDGALAYAAAYAGLASDRTVPLK